MLGRLRLALFTCTVIVGVFTFSNAAIALTDPDCDGSPYPNDPLIHELYFDTTDTHVSYEPSGLVIEGLVCGSDLRSFRGDKTLYDKIDIGIAQGVWIHPTDWFREPPYAGDVVFSGLVRVGGPHFFEGERSNLRAVIPGGETDCPTSAVACYKASNSSSHSWIWVVENVLGVPGDYVFTIGPIYWSSGHKPGITRFRVNLCRSFGFGNKNECDREVVSVVQKNGNPSNCRGGNGRLGIYTVDATQRGGLVTPYEKACVAWTRGVQSLNFNAP